MVAQVGHGAAAVAEDADGAARGFRSAGDLAEVVDHVPGAGGSAERPQVGDGVVGQITARGSPLALSELLTI